MTLATVQKTMRSSKNLKNHCLHLACQHQSGHGSHQGSKLHSETLLEEALELHHKDDFHVEVLLGSSDDLQEQVQAAKDS